MEQEELYSGNHDEYVNKKKQELLNGEFIVKHFRSKNGQISNFKNLLNSYKAQGIFFQLICVDGLNQVKLEKGEKYLNDNDKFEHLCEEFRDWAEEEQMCIICNFQTNRCLEISTLVDKENEGKVRIDSLIEGDKILTKEGYKKVVKIYEKEYQPVYKIKLKNGQEILCSGKHEFPTKEGGLLSIENGLGLNSTLIIKK